MKVLAPLLPVSLIDGSIWVVKDADSDSYNAVRREHAGFLLDCRIMPREVENEPSTAAMGRVQPAPALAARRAYPAAAGELDPTTSTCAGRDGDGGGSSW
jgi:hypothetical protein